MKEAYKHGLAEVDEILKFADEESINKIPEKFMTFIKENKSDYKASIDPDKDLKDQDLLYETKVILSVLYRDYWASKEEREQLAAEEKMELQKVEEEKKEKYKYEDLFRNKQDETGTDLIIKESMIAKILNRIKSFFRLGG